MYRTTKILRAVLSLETLTVPVALPQAHADQRELGDDRWHSTVVADPSERERTACISAQEAPTVAVAFASAELPKWAADLFRSEDLLGERFTEYDPPALSPVERAERELFAPPEESQETKDTVQARLGSFVLEMRPRTDADHPPDSGTSTTFLAAPAEPNGPLIEFANPSSFANLYLLPDEREHNPKDGTQSAIDAVGDKTDLSALISDIGNGSTRVRLFGAPGRDTFQTVASSIEAESL